MKTFIILVMISLITACGSVERDELKSPFTSTTHFTTRGLDCVFVKASYGGGLSCNWEKYNKENKK